MMICFEKRKRLWREVAGIDAEKRSIAENRKLLHSVRRRRWEDEVDICVGNLTYALFYFLRCFRQFPPPQSGRLRNCPLPRHLPLVPILPGEPVARPLTC